MEATKQRTTTRRTDATGIRRPVPGVPARGVSIHKIAAKLRKKIDSACSATWALEIREGRTDYPISGMVLSRSHVLTGSGDVSNNRGEAGTRRWTPPAHLPDTGVALEDRLDGMSIAEARRYQHPSAIIYTERHSYGEAAYDPRKVYIADKEPVTIRVAPWRVKRNSVKVWRNRRLIAVEEWCEYPEELTTIVSA
jgi:hypothetical protein